jgi:EmrB/QacA subfamily drug resistance transporter
MTSAAHVNCDTAVAKAAQVGTQPPHPRLVLAATILASSLAMVDGSVVNVGLPAIGRTLQASAADLQWVVNAYLLPLSALLLLGGALGDRFGRRRLLVVGTLLFAAASIGCALAPSIGWLLFTRAVQGVGAALLMPSSLAILGGAFSGEARGRAIGTWAATGAMAAALGPVLGGWLIDTVGWPAIFLLNIPLAAAAIVLTLRFVVEEPRDQGEASLDVAGALLATVALGALAWGLTIGAGPDGWTTSAVIATLAGIALMLAFVWVEKHAGDQAMMPLVLFGSRSFVGLSLLTLLIYGMLGGLLILLPYVLIRSVGYSATVAGAALLPFPLAMALASPGMGALAGRVGARAPLTIGSLVVAVGLLLTLRIGRADGYWLDVAPAMLVISIGMSAVAAPLTTAVLASVDARHTGSASGFNSALARAGGLIATALLGAVLAKSGAALLGDFHWAAIAGAVTAVVAAACAFLLVRDRRKGAGSPSRARPR